jgi:hypothetical protein
LSLAAAAVSVLPPLKRWQRLAGLLPFHMHRMTPLQMLFAKK